MQKAIIIPARYGSTRLPGKPLRDIAKVSMLERVWRIARVVKGIDHLLIATDDHRILEKARQFGAEAVLTAVDCKNGSERVLAAINLTGIKPDLVLNLQGDAPITPPWVLQSLIDDMAESGADLGTPAIELKGDALTRFLGEKLTTPSSGTSVVLRKNGTALYFSKFPLPFSRSEPSRILRHIGLYAYRTPILRHLLSLPEGELEKEEQLEQLRALENGIEIKVTIVDYRGRSHASVDTEEDIRRVESIIAREGELIVD